MFINKKSQPQGITKNKMKEKEKKNASTSTPGAPPRCCCTRRLFNPKQLPFTHSKPLAQLIRLLAFFSSISSPSLLHSSDPHTENKGQEVVPLE
jgi:hypothetical protein